MTESRRQSVSVPRDGGHSHHPMHHAPSSSAAAAAAGPFGGRRMSRRQSLAGSHKTETSMGLTRQATASAHHHGFGGSGPENTYRLGPLPGEEFDAGEVQLVLKELLKVFLDGEPYAYNSCSQMSLNLTDVIRRRLKEMNFRRFRFVCQVIIGEDKQQGIECTSRCLWDAQTDRHANASYRKGNLFAVATVFAVYLE